MGAVFTSLLALFIDNGKNGCLLPGFDGTLPQEVSDFGSGYVARIWGSGQDDLWGALVSRCSV